MNDLPFPQLADLLRRARGLADRSGLTRAADAIDEAIRRCEERDYVVAANVELRQREERYRQALQAILVADSKQRAWEIAAGVLQEGGPVDG